MSQIIPLRNLLKLLEISGNNNNKNECAKLIEEIVNYMYPGYIQECNKISSKTLIEEAILKLKHLEDLKIKEKNGKYEISYHVSEGCSGDWHEKDIVSHFHLFHIIRGFIQHF